MAELVAARLSHLISGFRNTNQAYFHGHSVVGLTNLMWKSQAPSSSKATICVLVKRKS
jgi:hypothetical protein